MRVRHLGQQDYRKTWERMLTFTEQRDANTPDELWLLEHPPVFTLGQAGKPEHIIRADHNIPVVKTDRGGQVTYHGPGQLVAYVLCDLKRKNIGVRSLVCLLEQIIIDTLAHFEVTATGDRERPGVYVQQQKIASIGLRIKRGCSYHGIAFNIDMDLTPFSYINPCGYQNLSVTQLVDILNTQNKLLTSEANNRLEQAQTIFMDIFKQRWDSQ